MNKRSTRYVIDALPGTPVPKVVTLTPLDILWHAGPDGPVALCGPCARKRGLALLSTNGREPYANEACEDCQVKEEQQAE
jgi:hypothetical protein